MRIVIALFILFASCGVAAAQGCGSQNPNCIVPTAPSGTDNNQAASTAFVQQAIGGPGANPVSGPATSVIGDIVLWANTIGTLTSDGGGGAPFWPVIHPSSGNFQGSGNPTAHQLIWSDTNVQFNADAIKFTSNDPSAGFTLTLGGSVTTGDIISLTITMGSGNCNGAGCTVTTGPATGGDTLTTLAGKLACAIAQNTLLFNLNGGSCAGGVPSGPNGTNTFGGYALGNPIGYVVFIPSGLVFDFNSLISLKVTSSVSGSATETVTIANSNCSTRCSYPFDNNPNIQFIHQAGIAPQPGSAMAELFSVGADSLCPTSICRNWGALVMYIGNSTFNSEHSAWLLQTPNTAGALNGGTYFGQGIFANVGCAVPLGASPTGCVQDQGVGTVNMPAVDYAGSQGGYWLDGADHISRNAGSSQFIINATTGDDIIINSTGGGVGINATPGANTFVTALPLYLGIQQTTQGTLTFANTAAGAFATTIKSSNSASAAATYTWPVAPPVGNGYALTATTAGVMSWTNPTTFGGTPCTTTASSIQYDAAGSFGCVSGVTSNGTAMTFANGDLILSGSSSGSSVLQAPATGGGTVTLMAGTDTVAGLGTAQTFTALQTINTLKFLQPEETATALTGCNGSTATINLTTGSYFYCTVSTGTVTLAVSNPAASGLVSSFTLELTNGGSQTVNWMTGTKWPGGVAPTLTTSGVDLLVCSTRDGATTWRCVASELNSH